MDAVEKKEISLPVENGTPVTDLVTALAELFRYFNITRPCMSESLPLRFCQ
jgi:hypothetical protein